MILLKYPFCLHKQSTNFLITGCSTFSSKSSNYQLSPQPADNLMSLIVPVPYCQCCHFHRVVFYCSECCHFLSPKLTDKMLSSLSYISCVQYNSSTIYLGTICTISIVSHPVVTRPHQLPALLPTALILIFLQIHCCCCLAPASGNNC